MLLRLFHAAALAMFLYGLYYDYHYMVLPPHMKPKNDIKFWKGKGKFLTMWTLVAAMNAMKSLMHLVACVQFGYGCYYDWFYVRPPVAAHPMSFDYAGKLKYLTFWDAVVQTLYFFIAFLNDLIGTNENRPAKSPLIRRIKDYSFASLAFPSAMYVGITFWGLWAIDRELVFPKALDEFFPNWLNHLMHTNIMIFAALELCTTFRKYPTRKSGLAGLICYLLAYVVWMHVIYYHSGKWVYPLLEVLNWPARIVFYAATLAFGIFLYAAGEFLNNKIWSKQLGQMKKSAKKKPN